MNLAGIKEVCFDQMKPGSWMRTKLYEMGCDWLGGVFFGQIVQRGYHTARVFGPKQWIPKVSSDQLKWGCNIVGQVLGFATMFQVLPRLYSDKTVAVMGVITGILYLNMRWRAPPPKLPTFVKEVKGDLKLTEAFAKYLEPLKNLEAAKKEGKINSVFAKTGLSLRYLARSVATVWADKLRNDKKSVYYVEGGVKVEKWKQFLKGRPNSLVIVDKPDLFKNVEIPKEMICCEVFCDEERTYRDHTCIQLGQLSAKDAQAQLGRQIRCADLIQRIGMPEYFSLDQNPEIDENGIIASLSKHVNPMQLISSMSLLGINYKPSHEVSMPRALMPVEVRDKSNSKPSRQWTVFSSLSRQQIANQEYMDRSTMFFWDINYEETALNHLLNFLYQHVNTTLIGTYKPPSDKFPQFLNLVPKETRIFLYKSEPLYADETLGPLLEGFFTYGERKKERPKQQPAVSPASQLQAGSTS